jgi:hypothetical protein
MKSVSLSNVALMSGESGGFALQNLLRRIARSRGWLASGPGEHLRICTAVPGLSCEKDMEALERFIVETEIRVLAIDPTYLAMRGLRADAAGNLFAVGALLDPLSRMAERTGCTPIVVHHNSRGASRANAGEPAELADIAWSGFAEWAGQWMLLARRERFNPDSAGEHRLWLSAGGRDGHAMLAAVNVLEGRQSDPEGRRWDVEIEGAARARAKDVEADQERKEATKRDRQARQLEKDTETIVEALKAAGGGTTKRQLRDSTGIRTTRFDPAFAAVLSAGQAKPVEVQGANNRTYEGYRYAAGRSGTQRDVPLRPAEVASSGTHSIYRVSRCAAGSCPADGNETTCPAAEGSL